MIFISRAKKILSILIFVIVIFINSILLILPSYIINKSNSAFKIVRDLVQPHLDLLYNYGFGSKIRYSGKVKITDKVDIVTSNHVNSFDFAIYLSIIRQFSNKDIYIICRNNLVYIPIFGFYFNFDNFIKINKNIELDVDIFKNELSKINSGIIVIMPEGTRFTEEKYKNSQEYSSKNNLHIFKNLLFPKMKGLHAICNILNENNKLGNIIDLTIKVDKMFLKKSYVDDMILNELGDTSVVINNYKMNHINNYNLFKNFFINKWIIKDNILDNMNKYNYKDLKSTMPLYKIFLIINLLCVFIHLIIYSKYILPSAIIIIYLITIYNS